MKRFLHFVLIVSTVCSGIAAQIDFVFNPQKYNAITLDTSRLPAPVAEPRVDDFVQLEEVRMHYQIWGKGKTPLILIHGNGGSVKSLREAAQYLANEYTVYLPESRCHGQSSDPGEISYALMAKDYAQFIAAMGLQKPLIMGHSDGGINAIQIAADYPDLPGAIIACGANSNPDTFKPYFPFGVWVKNIFKPDKLNDMMQEKATRYIESSFRVELNIRGLLKLFINRLPVLMLFFFGIKKVLIEKVEVSYMEKHLLMLTYMLLYISCLFFNNNVSAYLSQRFWEAACYPLTIFAMVFLRNYSGSLYVKITLYGFLISNIFNMAYTLYTIDNFNANANTF